MADLEDYLQEGFDPRSVTMPRLRSILVTHNIEYPASAQKAKLVQLVTEHVLPQVPKIRAQRARAKRSSYGIVNAGSAEDNGRWDDTDFPPQPSSQRQTKRIPRQTSARIKVEEDESSPRLRSPAKRSLRSTSRQLSHADDEDFNDQERPHSRRRSRRTETPQMKAESEGEDSGLPLDEDSVFTDDNPFQSGSSPPRMKTPRHRRRTTDEKVSKSPPSAKTRAEFISASIGTGRTPLLARQVSPEALLEPGEEFTPDEQLELEEAASKGELSALSQQPLLRTTRARNFTTPLTVLCLSLLGVYGAWYRQEKMAVGFCGLGRPAMEIIPPYIQLPDAVVPFIEPQCEPCPQHAYCYEDFSVACEPDFVLKPHPLSFWGLVPLPPSCEPDSEKARRVRSVADKAVEELRGRRAKYECGSFSDESPQENSPAINEEELKEAVSRKRSKRLSSAEFDDLWAAAIGDVTRREEIEVETAE